MQEKCAKCELLPILDELHIVWVPLLASPMETVQIVIPHHGDCCDDNSWQSKKPDRQSEQDVAARVVTLSICVGYPHVDKDLNDVSDDGEGPGEYVPAGSHVG